MNQRQRKSSTGTNAQAALTRTMRSVFNLLPVIVGTLLLTSLAFTLIPREGFKALFGRHEILDVLLGAAMGNIAAQIVLGLGAVWIGNVFSRLI